MTTYALVPERKERTTAMAAAGMLTREQLANEIGLTEQTIKNWEADGLPRVRVSDKVILYHVPSVVKWMLKRGAK